MTEEQEVPKQETPSGSPEPAAEPTPAAEPPPPEGAPEGTAPVEAKEVEEGKVFAILSYVLSLVCIPFFLIPLIMRNNEFSLYHAKQCLMLWLVGIVGSVVSSILMMVCIGFVLALAVGIFCLVLTIMGIMNASKGQMTPLPVVGKWAEDWFKGLRKA